MKNFKWLIAVFAIFALLIVGCGDGDPDDDGELWTPGDDDDIVLELLLADNFQYDESYQGTLNALDYITGKIEAGDQFRIKITFAAARDSEDVIELALVDGTPAADYWTVLIHDDDYVDVNDGEIVERGEWITFQGEFTAITSATAATADANQIVFTTKGEGTPGTANSGKLKPFKLYFTEFEFERLPL